MIGVPVTAHSACRWARARCVGDGSVVLRHLCIDSREAKPHSLFVALPGRTTDGHAYLHEVLSFPATAVLIRRSYYRAHRTMLRAHVANGRRALLIVSDPLRGEGGVARRYLERLSPPCKIAITGSSGKTTTKELLAAIIGRRHDLHYTVANQNSAIGIPLAILRMKRAHRYMVTEVGTGYPGEIPAIAAMLNPHIVVITNLGHAHIEAFGSKRAIATEKLSLARNSSAARALYIHSRDRHLMRPLRRSVQVHCYDRDPFASRITCTPDRNGMTITIDGHTVHTQLHGMFQHDNVRAAAVVAHHIGMPTTDIAAGIRRYRPLFGRMQRIDGDSTIILDCYNANPESTDAVLHYFQQESCDGRKICVLGGMKELGTHSAVLHAGVFSTAVGMGFQYLFCIGPEFAHLDFDAHAHAYHMQSVDEASVRVQKVVRSGDMVLLKGSRSVGLEEIAEQIQAAERRG